MNPKNYEQPHGREIVRQFSGHHEHESHSSIGLGDRKKEDANSFEILYPKIYCEDFESAHSQMQVECILYGSEMGKVEVTGKFLQFLVDGTDLENQRAVERRLVAEDLDIARLLREKKVLTFQYYAPDFSNRDEYLLLEARLSTHAMVVPEMRNAYLVIVKVENITQVKKRQVKSNADSIRYAFVSTHILMQSKNAEIMSLQNYSGEWLHALERCREADAWPVLPGESKYKIEKSPIIIESFSWMDDHEQ